MSDFNITRELISASDEKYREFQSGLLPGINNVLGVRAPILKAIAKKYANTPEGDRFMSSLPHTYYDENMAHGYMLGYLRADRDSVICRIKEFLPYIDNWAVCDSAVSNLKSVLSDPDFTYKFASELVRDKREYHIRLGLVCLLSYCMDKDHIDSALRLVGSIRDERYYVKMAQAWLVSVALAKEFDMSVWILRDNILPAWTHNKAIQKSRESFRIDGDKKQYLLSLKRKV